MSVKRIFIVVVFALVFAFITAFLRQNNNYFFETTDQDEEKEISGHLDSLSIEALKKTKIDSSDIKIEQNLPDKTGYKQFIASYLSEGLTQFALLTVPKGEKPPTGWPVIIFNHGFIQPQSYRTTERYVSYVDRLARNGYIVLKPDYRGHGESEGEAVGGYGSNSYTIDVLNALESIKKYHDADPKRIGMWGHSMGGHITLRAMVVNQDIKAGVIWAGVVASYSDLLNSWRRQSSAPPLLPTRARRWRETLVKTYGTPEDNPTFWNSISSTSYLTDISGPLQLHHGTADSSVPVDFSKKLNELLKKEKKPSMLYLYEEDDHNLSRYFNLAMSRSVKFFDENLKK